MKKIVFVFLMLISSVCIAQHRTDYWLLGYDNNPDPILNRPTFLYSGGIMDTLCHEPFRMNFLAAYAFICDTMGQVLFYSNGQWVANRNNDTLLNSELFNPGNATNLYPDKGLPIFQSLIILPMPDSVNKYYLFHESSDIITVGGNTGPLSLKLKYSIIDMNKDSSRGEMIVKGAVLLNDTLVKGKITACKHANGKDWWLITHQYGTDKYIKFLVTSDSIYGPFIQHIGQTTTYDYGTAYSAFSPDGEWYVSVTFDGKIDIMRFNRCKGQFYNCICDSLPVDIIFDGFGGVAYSASNRFLYVNSGYNLFQFDLENTDIISSRLLVGIWDGNCVPQCSYITFSQLAPDNKIYFRVASSLGFYHVINYPDKIDTACDFKQRAITFCNYNQVIPTYPNYDLGPLTGSGCDTLNQPPEAEFHFSLYPNPVSEQLKLTFHVESESKLKVYDVLGREAMEFTLYPYFKSNVIDVSKLPSGLYLYEVSDGGKRLQTGKFVKVRAN